MTDGRIVSPFWAFEGKERGGEGGQAGAERREGRRQCGEDKQAKLGTAAGTSTYETWRGEEARRTCENANMT